jgi:hypothetical protein
VKTFFIVIGALLLGAGALWLWQKRGLIQLAEKNKDIIDAASSGASLVGDIKSIFSTPLSART